MRRRTGKRSGSKHAVHEGLLAPFDFPLRKRPESQDLPAPCQRFRKVRQEQDIGGAGQQIASGSALSVHIHLERVEELRSALDFVQHDGSVEGFEKAGWIRKGSGLQGGIIQRNVARRVIMAGNRLAERAFPDLTRTDEQSDRTVLQGME
jgi:hypothetical protein